MELCCSPTTLISFLPRLHSPDPGLKCFMCWSSETVYHGTWTAATLREQLQWSGDCNVDSDCLCRRVSLHQVVFKGTSHTLCRHQTRRLVLSHSGFCSQEDAPDKDWHVYTGKSESTLPVTRPLKSLPECHGCSCAGVHCLRWPTRKAFESWTWWVQFRQEGNQWSHQVCLHLGCWSLVFHWYAAVFQSNDSCSSSWLNTSLFRSRPHVLVHYSHKATGNFQQQNTTVTVQNIMIKTCVLGYEENNVISRFKRQQIIFCKI